MNEHFSPQKILAPVDFSTFSDEALRTALSIGEEKGAEVTVLNVMEEPIPPAGLGVSPKTAYVPADRFQAEVRERRSEIEQETHEHLKELIKKINGTTAKVKSVAVWADPRNGIVQMAEGAGYDLIVMSTRGRTGVNRLFMGSVAEHVVRHAPCPVLTIRKEPTESESS